MAHPASLTLIRHGETVINKLGASQAQNDLFQEFLAAYEAAAHSRTTHTLATALLDSYTTTFAASDIPLSNASIHQVETMTKALQLRAAIPDVIYVSPYKRTLHTLDIMAKAWPSLQDIPTYQDARLQEQDRGIMEMYKSWRIFNVLEPEQGALKQRQGRHAYRYPDGESMADVEDRTRAWLNDVSRTHTAENILAVTHAGAIVALRANIELLSPDEVVAMYDYDTPINAGVTRYQEYCGRLALHTYNAKLY